MGFLSWLAGTRAGRWLFGIGAAAAALFLAVIKIFAAGRAAEKTRQDKASLDALRRRSKTDDDVSKLSDDAARRELGRWVQRDQDNG